MRALVTGGGGFIRSLLSELLPDDGHVVFPLDDLSPGEEGNLARRPDRQRLHLVVDVGLSPPAGRPLALRHERGLNCVIARLFNTVGPRQNSRYGNVIPRFVQRALAGEQLEIHGDGSQTRCFCHVADVVRALRGLLELADGEIYNVGSTDRITIRELSKRVLEATGSSSELAF